MQVFLFLLPSRKSAINFEGREVKLHSGRRNQVRGLHFHKSPLKEVLPDRPDDLRAEEEVGFVLGENLGVSFFFEKWKEGFSWPIPRLLRRRRYGAFL
jgi:hypothetical protein